MTDNNPARGLLFALYGFAMLSAGDAVIKTIGGTWPGTAVAALRYCFGAAGLAVMLWRSEGAAGFVVPMPKLQLLRGFSVAVATIAFFSSIVLMPLAEATAIVFVGPLLTALISRFWLNERAGWATWLAAGVAFVGVLIIVRPNFAILGAAALLPLVAATGMAFLMIGNRKAAGLGSPLQMQFLIAAVAAPILVIAAILGHLSGISRLHVGLPDWTILLRCAIVAVTATCSHWLVYLGTTKASAAQIAPMVYVQILVALLLGFIVFGDRPDMISLGGSALIVAAGLGLWMVQRRA